MMGSLRAQLASQFSDRSIAGNLPMLGVPGLINAYKTSSALVLQTIPIIKRQVETKYILQFDYTMINEIMHIIKLFNCSIIHQEIQLFSTFTIGIAHSNLGKVLNKLKEMRNVEIKKLLP